MKTIDNEHLAGLTIDMLERTAMVLAEPAVEGAAPASATRCARIVFSGPTRGTLMLCADDGFVRELAAGLLGIEPSEIDVDTQGADALKEMANMIGGSVIVALSGETCEYSLGLPELVAPSATPAGKGTNCRLSTECGSLRVHLGDAPAARAA